MVVFVKIFNQRWSVLSLNEHQDCSGLDIKRQICEIKGVQEDDIFLTCNGCIVENQSRINFNENDTFVHCHLRVPGGKGGFGSMLRAIGAQIEKTTNREACRDLSGRRMRDVNDEKKIADWLSKQAERDQEKARRKQERLERLQTAPKHVFEGSTTYTTQLQQNVDSIDDALQKGLKSSSSGQSSSSSGKRKIEDKKIKKSHMKKRKLWHDIDEELSSESDEESDRRSSCSSITDSDFSVSESTSKASSTASNNDLSSGKTTAAEGECSSGTSSLCGESRDNSQPNVVDTSQSLGGYLDKDTNSTLSGTENYGQLVKPEIDKQEAIASMKTSVSDKLKPSEPKIGRKENPEPKSEEVNSDPNQKKQLHCSTKTDACSSKSTSSTADVELKCENTEKVSTSLDLDQYQSPAELQELGLDVLKSALMSLGVKCGGTLQQRAERLFSIKGVPRDKIDPSLFAKPSGKNKEKRR